MKKANGTDWQGTKVEHRFVKVGEINTHYLVGGEGPPLVLIHGGGTTIEEAWVHNLPSLAQYYQVYAPDLVGHGKSDRPPAEYTFSFVSESFASFVEALDLEKVSLIGHALGGGIAIDFAIDHPGRVEKLIAAKILREIMIDENQGCYRQYC
ncbi:Haloalkane dehalogenase [subsurface metagenome]